MADSFVNALNNLVSQTVEDALAAAGVSKQSVNNDFIVTGGATVVNAPPLPGEEDYGVGPQDPSIPPPPVPEPPSTPLENPPLQAPDSSTFIVDQELVQPTLSSDVASVTIVISLDDIQDAANYEVRWATA